MKLFLIFSHRFVPPLKVHATKTLTCQKIHKDIAAKYVGFYSQLVENGQQNLKVRRLGLNCLIHMSL